MNEQELITVLQERPDNGILTVRRGDVVLGRVLQYGRGDWRIMPEQPDSFVSLTEAVRWLVKERGDV